VQAAALAQRAVDHITGQSFIEEEDGDAGEDGTPVHASIPLAA
jgi:hypothetical protein